MDYLSISNKFPKSREPLPKEYSEIYEEHYGNRIIGKEKDYLIFGSRMESWAHKIIAKAQKKKSKILEIGAGTLNHLKYENDFTDYDVVEPFKIFF